MESLSRETYGSYYEEYQKEKDEIENLEMWLELAMLEEKGLPKPKTVKVNPIDKQLALERAILNTETKLKERREKLLESHKPNKEPGQP